MNRRAFISLLGGAAAWPLAARAQQPAIPTIGFLSTASAASIAPYVEGFRRGLAAAGFAEGRNVAIDYRWADNQPAAALAAKAATSAIPIVFTIGADPVKFGLVDSMSRPSGNVTGVSFLSNDLVTKQLQLLQTLLPPASVIGVLANPNNPNAEFDTGKTQAAAASLRLQVHAVNVAAERDIDAAFDDLARVRAAALLVFPDTLFIDVRRRLAEIVAARKLPAIYSNRLYVEEGGLMSYGSSPIDAFREAGIYTGRILRGEKPSDLPVVQPTKFELVINLKTAKALGLDLPPTLLALADEVIE